MTHSTDAGRAEFEEWFNEKNGSGSGEVHGAAWDAWKESAARRAPAAPVPQGWRLVPEESTEAMARAFRADDAPYYFAMTTIRCSDFAARYRAALAAAPRPPEAAPAELPCVERIDVIDVAKELKENISAFGDTKGKAKEKAAFYLVSQHEQILYWQQQVRDLLAAHGIGKDKA